MQGVVKGPAPFKELLAVIRGEDEDRIFEKPCSLEALDEIAEETVGVENLSVVERDETLSLPLLIRLESLPKSVVVDELRPVETRLLFFAQETKRSPVVHVERIVVGNRWHVGIVNLERVKEEEERLVLSCVRRPLNDVFEGSSAMVVVALESPCKPESSTHVASAGEGAAPVACVTQRARQGRNPVGERVCFALPPIADSVDRGLESGEKRHVGSRGLGSRAQGSPEEDPFPAPPIQVGARLPRVAVGGQVVGSQSVDAQEDQIGAWKRKVRIFMRIRSPTASGEAEEESEKDRGGGAAPSFVQVDGPPLSMGRGTVSADPLFDVV